MKLFSKFQDYYDCTLGSFLESDVVIRRETETHDVSPKEFAPLGNFEGKWNYMYEGRFGKTYSTWLMHMIGFCGKWYFFKCDSLEFNRDAINPETIEYKTFDEIVKNNKEMSIASYLTRCYHLDRNIDYKNPNDDKFWNSEIFEKYGPVLYMNQYLRGEREPQLGMAVHTPDAEAYRAVGREYRSVKIVYVHNDPFLSFVME